MFTHKDTTFTIMEKMDDMSLLNLCLTNKFISDLCNDEHFWQKRFTEKFGIFDKDINKTWKRFYLQIIYYMDIANGESYEDKLNNAMGLSAQDGEFDLVQYFISKGADNWKMGRLGAEKGGYLEIAKFFKDKEPIMMRVYARRWGRPMMNYYINIDDYTLYGPKKRVTEKSQYKKDKNIEDID